MTRHLLPIASRADTTRLAGTLLGRRRGPLLVSAIAFVLVGLAGLVAPWILGDIVDTVTTGGDESRILHGTLLIAAASVVAGIGTSFAVACLARAGEPALADLREQALDRALHLDSIRLEEAGAGDLLSRVGDDVRSLAQSLTQIILPQAFRTSVPPVGSVIIAMFKNSAVVGAFGVGQDLFSIQKNLVSAQGFRYIPVLTGVAVGYLIITLTASVVLEVLERKVAIAR